MEADAFLMIQRRVPHLLSNWVVMCQCFAFICVSIVKRLSFDVEDYAMF